jgi:tripartite-type tricarboxylate transporter receptor subunit TctC
VHWRSSEVVDGTHGRDRHARVPDGRRGAAQAQETYPSRPIDFVVTWGTGGGADGMARELGSLTQPTDGYTLATYIADTLATIPFGLARHKVDDLEWIVRTQVADSFLFVKTDRPFKTIHNLLEHGQAHPGKLRVASTGYGSVDDLAVRYLEKRGYKMTTVPYSKPGERYAAATLGGQAEVLYEQAGDVQQYLKAGQLRPKGEGVFEPPLVMGA